MTTYPRILGYPERSDYHDSEHVVAALLNELDDALSDEAGVPRLSRLVDELVRRAQRELHDEEEAMKRASYPSLSFHCAKHRFFVHEIEQLRSVCSSGNRQFLKRIVRFLCSWLQYHWHNDDSRFGGFVENRSQPAIPSCGH